MPRVIDPVRCVRLCFTWGMLWGLLAGMSWGSLAAAETVTFYVAPTMKGDGSATEPSQAASWNDKSFWNRANQRLGPANVEVVFLEGEYHVSSRGELELPRLILKDLGHEDQQLTIRGESAEGVIITRHPEDPLGKDHNIGLFSLSDSRNVTIRHLHFTAPAGHTMGYATSFARCQDLTFVGCRWVDIPQVQYGATGIHHKGSDRIIYRDCKFARIGQHSGAHMAYNANFAYRIAYIDCHFEDCSGDYIRFRNGTEFCVVTGCTFRSTGKWAGTHRAFIAVPVFNDVDPGDEWLGTHFLIFGNKFLYADREQPNTRIVLYINQRGYTPEDRKYLPTEAEGKTLSSGTPDQRRTQLWENFQIDPQRIHLFDNQYKNVAHKVLLQTGAAYGANPQGGDGRFRITDLVNREVVVESEEAALRFFDAVVEKRTSQE